VSTSLEAGVLRTRSHNGVSVPFDPRVDSTSDENVIGDGDCKSSQLITQGCLRELDPVRVTGLDQDRLVEPR
jgi:hypothetical protein